MLVNETHDKNMQKRLKNKYFRMYRTCKSFAYIVDSTITFLLGDFQIHLKCFNDNY